MADGSCVRAKTKKMYLIDRKDPHGEKRYCLNGFCDRNRQPQKENLRQSFSQYVQYSPTELPAKVDFRRWMTKVEDQSKTNSCTANAIAGAYEYLIKKVTGEAVDVSRLFIYYNSRVKAIDDDETHKKLADNGSAVCDAIESLEEMGVCLESMWPFEIKNINTKPSEECYNAAEKYNITEAYELRHNLYEMKSCVAQGFPIVIGVNLFNSFNRAKVGGKVPMPSQDEEARKTHGRHALLICGYCDSKQSFLLRNSWGEQWGKGGYCYMPYAYLTNPKLCRNGWTIKTLNSYDMGKDTWEEDNDDSSDEDDDGGSDGDDGDIEDETEEDSGDEDKESLDQEEDGDEHDDDE